MHGQADDAPGDGVAHGEVGCGVGHGGLLIDGDGVVHSGWDARGLELLLHALAVGDLDGVLGPGAGVVGFQVGKLHGCG